MYFVHLIWNNWTLVKMYENKDVKRSIIENDRMKKFDGIKYPRELRGFHVKYLLRFVIFAAADYFCRMF